MGKRKLHGQMFYQCDWTGYPMAASNCYMPTWHGDKLVKRGSYCNWESVLAHAHHMYNVDKSLEESELERVTTHLTELIGVLPDYKQYHYTFLDHFKSDPEILYQNDIAPRSWDMTQFHEACCKTVSEITAVKINPEGMVFDVLMTPDHTLADYISRPYMASTDQTPSQFQSMRKGRLPKDRDLTAFYWPGKNGLPHNMTASNIFKLQIYGDVLLVQQTKELSFKPRERYVNFNKQQFDDLFQKKRKKSAEEKGLTTEEFQQVKEQMQSSLNGFEALVSSSVERPQDLARGAKMPRTTGKELKEVAQHLEKVSKAKKKKLEARMVEPRGPLKTSVEPLVAVEVAA
jgi:hypothetical protein